MPALRAIFHLGLADFKERVRGYGFFVTVALAMFLSYEILNGDFMLALEDYRGVYNAAWMGLLMSMTLGFMLTIFGFYLVRGGMERDRMTGVGQILATTPMRKLSYVIGKFTSNFMVLVAVIGVLVAAAFVMLLTQGEDKTLNLWALISPFLLLTMPIAALGAAMAVLFEAVPFLSKGFGSVAFFFVWMFSTPVLMSSLIGINLIDTQVVAPLEAMDPTYSGGFVLGADGFHETTKTFVWDGFDWTPQLVGERLAWFGAALLITLAAALPFDRFDTAMQRGVHRGLFPRLRERIGAMFRRSSPRTSATSSDVHLTPLPAMQSRARLAAVFIGELRLMQKGLSWWWYVGAAGLILASLLSPIDVVKQALLPIAWLWPMLIWSQMGTREARHNTAPILFSATSPLWRQLPAMWLAGVLVAVITGGGAGVRFLMVSDFQSLIGWGIGALFLPTLAMALGVWSGTGRPFEILLLTLWYIGPMNRITVLDYTGTTPQGWQMGIPAIYAVITAGLFIAAVVGRARQVQQ